MNKLPNEIMNQIMLFNSHPVADLIKEAVTTVDEELYDYNSNACDNRCTGKWDIIEMSFADFSFNGSGGSSNSYHIYNYAWMDDIYVETLKEYLRNN